MSSEQAESLGQYLREAREAKGYSVRQLAALANVHYSFLARLESGDRTNPQPEYLQRLADALDLDVNELLRFVGIKQTLPDPSTYFRRKLGVDADEAEVLARLIEDYRNQKGGNHENTD